MGAAEKILKALAEDDETQTTTNYRNSFSEIPTSSSTVEVSHSLSDVTPRVIDLCKDLFKEWSELDDSCFSVETVSGGITNLLLKVTVKEENGNEVMITVRLYGPNTDYVINRERELQAIKHLSAAGFGAKLLGVFGNGMVQSFINARTLTPAASILQFDDLEKQKKYETISFKDVYNDILEIKELSGHLNSPVVFAHNDLLSGNLMVNDDEGKLYIIDFEYGSYSYRGFDIGNHFNEYAGYDCDYSLYPNKDKQYHFFQHYLQAEKPREVSEEDLEVLYIETNTFKLASHLFWALWALIQAKMSPIDFDYLGYFFLRYNEFKRLKEESCSLAQSYLSRCGSG